MGPFDQDALPRTRDGRRQRRSPRFSLQRSERRSMQANCLRALLQRVVAAMEMACTPTRRGKTHRIYRRKAAAYLPSQRQAEPEALKSARTQEYWAGNRHAKFNCCMCARSFRQKTPWGEEPLRPKRRAVCAPCTGRSDNRRVFSRHHVHGTWQTDRNTRLGNDLLNRLIGPFLWKTI